MFFWCFLEGKTIQGDTNTWNTVIFSGSTQRRFLELLKLISNLSILCQIPFSVHKQGVPRSDVRQSKCLKMCFLGKHTGIV